jgi:hypothetical protein
LTLEGAKGRQGSGLTKAKLNVPESPHCITTLQDTAYDLRASKAAILSEQIDIALLTMPSEMQFSEHAKIAYTSD